MKMISGTGKEEGVDTYGRYDLYGDTYIAAERAYYEGRTDPTQLFFTRWLYEEIDDAVLVDIGSGAGDELHSYVKMGARSVVGVEPSITMRQAAEEHQKSDSSPIKVVDGQFESLPFSDTSVDVVTARYSLHVLSLCNKAFEEVARVLKPGGLFLVSVAHPDYDKRMVDKQGKQIGDRIDLKLFGGKVVISNGTHTMSEYVEDTQKYFDCLDAFSYDMRDSESKEFTDLVIAYRRR